MISSSCDQICTCPVAGAGRPVELEVACYAGYRDEETPRRITIGARTIGVVEIIDRWYGPDHRYFKVAGDDGALYILRHEPSTGRWRLTLYERGAARPIGPREIQAP